MSDSWITKKAIADGFKRLMKEKRFEKITISDIAKECHLNRQTFYYHFQDKYELVNWIYYNEAIVGLTTNLTLHTWPQCICDMLTIMKREDYFYQNSLMTAGREEFQSYFFRVFKELFINVIEELSQGHPPNPDQQEFIAQFYSFGIVGTIFQWVAQGMETPPAKIALNLKKLVESFQSAPFGTASEPRYNPNL